MTSFDLIWEFRYTKAMFAPAYYLADIAQSPVERQNIPARGNGSMINYKLQILSNALNGQSTWTFEVNGIPKITILVAGLQTGTFTSLISVPFVKDDLLVFRYNKAATSATIQMIQSAKFQFTN